MAVCQSFAFTQQSRAALARAPGGTATHMLTSLTAGTKGATPIALRLLVKHSTHCMLKTRPHGKPSPTKDIEKP